MPAIGFKRYLLTAAFALMSAVGLHAEEGSSASHILLGQTGAASGPLAQLSGEYLGGARLYFDKVNASGGINGRRVELRTLDDGYQPERALQNARKLIDEDRVFALFGCFGTGPSQQVIPLAAERGVPFFAPYTGADSLREKPRRGVFHVRASYRQEIEKILDHLSGTGVRSIAIVHHADAFGEFGMNAAVQALAERSLKPVAIVPIEASGENATAVATRIATINPAAVILVTAGNSSSAFVRRLMATDARPMIYGLSVISSSQLSHDLGELAHGLVISQVVPSPYRFESPVANEYRNVAKLAKSPLSYAAQEGYMAAKIFSEALRRAGPDLDRARLVSALESINKWDLGGWTVDFTSRRRAASDYVDLVVISRSSFAP